MPKRKPASSPKQRKFPDRIYITEGTDLDGKTYLSIEDDGIDGVTENGDLAVYHRVAEGRVSVHRSFTTRKPS